MAKRRLVIAGLVLFFFAFPLGGMLYSYWKAHDMMRASAEAFVREKAQAVLRSQDFEELRFLATLTFKQDLQREEFESWFERLGSFESLDDLRVTRSTVGPRGDQVWHLVDFESGARFSRGSAVLRARAARRSAARAEWQFESFVLDVE